MARNINRLSDRTVRSLSRPGRHADGGNLFLIIDKPREKNGQTIKGAKRWAFIYRWGGKLREMGLGSVGAVSLGEARVISGQYRSLLARNLDPIEVRRLEQAQRRGRTFGEVAKELHEAKRAGFRNAKVGRQWLSVLEVYAAPIWSKPVDDVTTADVLDILKPIWTAKAETASRVRGRIEAVIDAARARGVIQQDRANCARWKGHLQHLLVKRQRLQRGHHRALPYVEVPAFVVSLRSRDATAARCLEFLVLTAARSNEAMGARWSEVDEATKVWTCPAVRMKMRRPHRVPLSDRCMEILAELKPLRVDGDSFVFPGTKAGKPLSVMALEMLLRRMKVSSTVHGFRSSFRDFCGDCTSFPREVAEAALAHRVGDETELAYRRADAIEKRRALMQAWCDYCTGKSADNVMQLRRPA